MDRSPAEWHLITSEYPPQSGGVSDYTRVVAAGLAAAGDAVHVWCPACDRPTPETPGVVVHRELAALTPTALRRVGQLLNRFAAPRRLLVQWVPHGYGYRSMNLFFCSWLRRRAALSRDRVEMMVHEPYLAFGHGTWRQQLVAVVHRLMTVVLLNAARRVWVSTPAWEPYWRPYTLGRPVPFDWLPIPSNVPVLDDPAGVAAARARYAAPGEFLLGHFGTYGPSLTGQLLAVLPLLLQRPELVVLLLGRGGYPLRDLLRRRYPELAGRLHASGTLAPADLSRYLQACDVVVQPYAEGANSRRTTLMAALAHGRPTVTTLGPFTEPLWAESGALGLAPAGDPAAFAAVTQLLLDDPAERARLGAAAAALYRQRFDVTHIVAALRGAAES
jgi:glycosyltransferase involved in cell wall biosynthesis